MALSLITSFYIGIKFSFISFLFSQLKIPYLTLSTTNKLSVINWIMLIKLIYHVRTDIECNFCLDLCARHTFKSLKKFTFVFVSFTFFYFCCLFLFIFVIYLLICFILFVCVGRFLRLFVFYVWLFVFILYSIAGHCS